MLSNNTHYIFHSCLDCIFSRSLFAFMSRYARVVLYLFWSRILFHFFPIVRMHDCEQMKKVNKPKMMAAKTTSDDANCTKIRIMVKIVKQKIEDIKLHSHFGRFFSVGFSFFAFCFRRFLSFSNWLFESVSVYISW